MRVIPYLEEDADKDSAKIFSFGLETRLATDVIDRLNEYISISNESVKDTLVGNISNSMSLVDKDNWFFSSILLPMISELKERIPNQGAFWYQNAFIEMVPYTLDAFWVNFQRQHEFNPIHNHKGHFSFVIFIKIPTDWREQHALPFLQGVREEERRASNFDFVLPHVLEEPCPMTYKLDSSYEGIMLFFPAEIFHTVYPFYNCEEERITISGNVGQLGL